MTCTFFGHREINQDIYSKLKYCLIELITTKKVSVFYVSNNGDFDKIVHKVLSDLKTSYPHINYAVVLASLPNSKTSSLNYTETLFPEELESTPPKFSIDKRNRWMLSKSDYVVCYVRRDFGGAAKFLQLALRRGKQVINIAEE